MSRRRRKWLWWGEEVEGCTAYACAACGRVVMVTDPGHLGQCECCADPDALARWRAERAAQDAK